MTASDHSYESPKERASLAREAGLGRLSFPSILAGVLVAYGAFAVLAAWSAQWRPRSASTPTSTETTGPPRPRQRHRRGRGAPGNLSVRRVRGRPGRAGLLNGLAVFLLAVVLVAVVGAVAASQADTEAIGSNLRGLGIPTTGTEWGKAGTIAGIGSLAAMLVGALLGGVLGERWHSKLTRRAVSGKYRPNRDDQPADRDPDRPPMTNATDPPDHKDDTGATRLTSPATRNPQPNGSAGHGTTASGDPRYQRLEPPYDHTRHILGRPPSAAFPVLHHHAEQPGRPTPTTSLPLAAALATTTDGLRARSPDLGLVECVGGTGPIRGSLAVVNVPAWRGTRGNAEVMTVVAFHPTIGVRPTRMGRAVTGRSHLHEVKQSTGPEAAGSDLGRPGPLLLETKLHVHPRVRRSCPAPTFSTLLDAGAGRQLTLVQAPTGFNGPPCWPRGVPR